MDSYEVLSSSVRRRIIEILANGDLSAGEIGDIVRDEFGLSQPATSAQLRVLRDSGFVAYGVDGARRLYAIAPGGFQAVEAAIAWLELLLARPPENVAEARRGTRWHLPSKRVEAYRQLAGLLIELAPLLRRLLDEILAPELSLRQYSVLLRVEEGHTSVTELAEIATVSLPAMSELVEGLVQRGLLERSVDRDDRRWMRLALTRDGELTLEEGRIRIDDLGATIADRISTSDEVAEGQIGGFERLVAAAILETKRLREIVRDRRP